MCSQEKEALEAKIEALQRKNSGKARKMENYSIISVRENSNNEFAFEFNFLLIHNNPAKKIKSIFEWKILFC